MLSGSLSEEGHLLYLQALQMLLPLLPVSENTSKLEVNSDSEDDDDADLHSLPMQVHRHQLIKFALNKLVLFMIYLAPVEFFISYS